MCDVAIHEGRRLLAGSQRSLFGWLWQQQQQWQLMQLLLKHLGTSC
jgi:hypothetical protein